MEPDGKKFGRGQRELSGAIDLLNHYRLLQHYEFFCKKPLPVSIADTHYLHHVVGDTEIRKGEGMQLGQLIHNKSNLHNGNVRIMPFDLGVLGEAFHLREAGPVELPPGEKGVPTIAGKSKSESRDKEKKHKRHKDKDRGDDKEHKKRKHRHKDRNKDEKKKDKSSHQDSGTDHAKKQHEKKRKVDDDVSDIHRHRKSKHKSSKIDEMGAIKVAG